ncbi:MAG: EF-P lysine aminoacylase GenX [Syntrophobacteraceae bacterium CG2_30_61_12]|nr:MAG: EF-P lysine aminoacylase GenX [Syntrophobacteraceae bacterium CG2_30_61_12]
MTSLAQLAAKKANLQARCRIIQLIRRFFHARDFLEVRTPVRTRAPAPEPYIEAIPSAGWFLAPSPELYMKRLLAAGYQKIFQIAPAFRWNETGRLHHSEFTLLEWYRADADHEALQQDCIELITEISVGLDQFPLISFQGHTLSVAGRWPRITVAEAFERWAGWCPGPDPDQQRFDLDLVTHVEPRLGFPTPGFLTDYPAGQAALARLKPGCPEVAERFELYWAGIELANGFSELTDPREQRRRFQDTLERRRLAGCSVYPLPEAFLDALRHLDRAAGIALGIDRLVAIFTNAYDLDQVVAFPPHRD